MNKSIAGILIFLSGAVMLMGIITAESFYPQGLYSTRLNAISDLGATRPPKSVVYQPSANIFNSSMILSGLMIIVACVYLFRSLRKKWNIVPIILFGFCAMAIGIFPANQNPEHIIFSVIGFISGGVGAIFSWYLVRSPLRYILVIFGLISLLIYFLPHIFIPYLGLGGAERWMSYLIVFWLTGLGAYLCCEGRKSKK